MIYLDNAATIRPLPFVAEHYAERMMKDFANPNSPHAFGKQSARDLEKAKVKMLSVLGISKSHRVVFLSGASEANNMAIKGIAHYYRNRGNRLITSRGEHASITNAFKALEREGYEVIYLPLDNNGTVSPEALEEALNDKTILVSIMGTNNETGAISPVDEYVSLIKKYPKCVYLCDLTQDIGKLPCNYANLDLFSFSAHKIGGLKGNGALVIKKGVYVPPLIDGGDQEYGLRGGTSDVNGDLALVEALSYQIENFPLHYSRVYKLNQRLRELLAQNDEYLLNSPADASPYVLNFSLKSKKASVVTEALSERGIYVGTVSACSSKKEPISEVLLAMGHDEGRARNSIRVSFSIDNTFEEIEEFYKALEEITKGLVDR